MLVSMDVQEWIFVGLFDDFGEYGVFVLVVVVWVFVGMRCWVGWKCCCW